MPRSIEAPEEPKRPAKRKQRRIEFRADDDTAERAEQRASANGWSLSSVLRALLSRFADEGGVSPDEIGEQNKRAPKQPKKK
jgi:antitoxin component of RelBE/YafQ-DinJ toxin-antitoxin module